MALFEHGTSVGAWFFKALVESSKLRQMTYSEEAAHRNRPNARVQMDSRETGGTFDPYDVHDAGYVLILQGIHAIVDEAPTAQTIIHAYIPYPTGPGLAPFLRRPVPVVGAIRGVTSIFPGTPTIDNIGFQPDRGESGELDDETNEIEAMPEAAVGVSGIDAVTDFRTSLVIAHRWSNNRNGTSVGNVYHGGYLFWRVVGHVEAY